MKGLDIMLKWFKTAHTLEDVKHSYRTLCKQYHPDLHGAATEEIMKEINAEYERAFNHYKNIHADTEGNTYTAETDSTETPEEFRKIIESLISCDGLTIELVGKWIWCAGNTYSYREILKSLHFMFSKNKKAWYWHRPEDGTRNHKKMTLDEIKDLYGCTEFKTQHAARITTA